MKALIEKKNALLNEADGIFKKCDAETRALTDEEGARLEAIHAEINEINRTIEARSQFDGIEIPASQSEGAASENVEETETRDFAHMIRYVKENEETRAAGNQTNFNFNSNGAIIPKTIVNRIITEVHELCPIFAGATVFHIKGEAVIPTYGASGDGDDVTVGYAEDFTELVAHAGAFSSVVLKGYLIGALAIIGRSLLNSSDIDLTNFVVTLMAEKMAIYNDKELLVGTANKCTGALSTTNKLVLDSAVAITADNLLDLQAHVKRPYQKNACWTMNRKTYTEIKKLKDGNGRYLIQDDFTKDFPYMLLGKPVNISENMPDIAAGAKPILYGDYSGLAVNFHEDISMQILREKYATQHAIGIVGWYEMDSKVMNAQKLATLELAAS